MLPRVKLKGAFGVWRHPRAPPNRGFSPANARFILSYEQLPHRTTTMIEPRPLKNLLGEGSDLAKSPLTAACTTVCKKASTDGIFPLQKTPHLFTMEAAHGGKGTDCAGRARDGARQR